MRGRIFGPVARDSVRRNAGAKGVLDAITDEATLPNAGLLWLGTHQNRRDCADASSRASASRASAAATLFFRSHARSRSHRPRRAARHRQNETRARSSQSGRRSVEADQSKVHRQFLLANWTQVWTQTLRYTA